VASGTVHAAGCARNGAAAPTPPTAVWISSDSAQATPPVVMPAMAPRAVSPRHHTPSSTMGESMDAANTNTIPTLEPSPSGTVSSATTSGTAVHSTADRRNDRTDPENTSWLTTPANDTTRPADVA